MGVARCKVGSGGLEAAGCTCWFPTALTLGDGGMAKPSLGALPPERPPGIAGRINGAGDESCGTPLGKEPAIGGAAEEPAFC